MRRQDRLDGFEFFCRIGASINLGGGQIGVAQPERDLANIMGGLSTTIAQVCLSTCGGYLFCEQRWASSTHALCMASQYISNSPTAQGLAARVDKQLWHRDCSTHRQPCSERRSRRFPKGQYPFSPAFAQDANGLRGKGDIGSA